MDALNMTTEWSRETQSRQRSNSTVGDAIRAARRLLSFPFGFFCNAWDGWTWRIPLMVGYGECYDHSWDISYKGWFCYMLSVRLKGKGQFPSKRRVYCCKVTLA